MKVVLTIVFAIAHELRGPPDPSAAQISPDQLRDLARLDAIDARMIWFLLALLLASLSLMAALDAPQWLAIAWLIVLGALERGRAALRALNPNQPFLMIALLQRAFHRRSTRFAVHRISQRSEQ